MSKILSFTQILAMTKTSDATRRKMFQSGIVSLISICFIPVGDPWWDWIVMQSFRT